MKFPRRTVVRTLAEESEIYGDFRWVVSVQEVKRGREDPEYRVWTRVDRYLRHMPNGDDHYEGVSGSVATLNDPDRAWDLYTRWCTEKRWEVEAE